MRESLFILVMRPLYPTSMGTRTVFQTCFWRSLFRSLLFFFFFLKLADSILVLKLHVNSSISICLFFLSIITISGLCEVHKKSAGFVLSFSQKNWKVCTALAHDIVWDVETA